MTFAMKRIKTFFRMLGCLALLSGFNLSQAQRTIDWTYPVPIDEKHFPDTIFRSYVSRFDINGDNELSQTECLSVEDIDVSFTEIESVEGIKYFLKLKKLDASNIQPPFDEEGNINININTDDWLNTDDWIEELENIPCLEQIDFSENAIYNAIFKTFKLKDEKVQLPDGTIIEANGWKYLSYGNSFFLFYNYNWYTTPESPIYTLEFLDISTCIAYQWSMEYDPVHKFWNQLLNCPLVGMNMDSGTIINPIPAWTAEIVDIQGTKVVDMKGSSFFDFSQIPGFKPDRISDLTGFAILADYFLIPTIQTDTLEISYVYNTGGIYEDGTPVRIRCHLKLCNYTVYTDTDAPSENIGNIGALFPDTHFATYVKENIDANHDGWLGMIEALITMELNLTGLGIEDLTGIEYLDHIQTLNCSGNNIKEAVLDSFPYLSSISMQNNPDLKRLKLSYCPTLRSLDCSNSAIESLDVSGCTALTMLDCSNNALQDLDVRSLIALRELDCSKNQLASLDLFRNANLVSVKADSNYREVLVNQDRQFDISTLPRFERARMEEIEGGTLQGDILTFHQDEVRYFYSYNNTNPAVPLGEYFHLKAVQAPVPGIAINDTTFPDAVFRGYIAENADTDKDSLLSESEIAGVTGLDVSGMGIQDLRGIEYFTELESLDCSDNALTSLDLSANTALQTLEAGGNRLDIVLDENNAFDVSSLPGFDMAKASDWTGCTRMGNRLTFTQQEVTYRYATGYSGSSEDAILQSVVFSLMADRDPSVAPERIVSIDEEHFPDSVFRQYITAADLDADHWLDEDEIAGVTGLDVSGMGIQDLRGIGYFTALESLDCSDNALTSLDLSANTALQTLDASGNRLDIVLDEDNTFDVSSLPGFDMAKASNWTGCMRTGNRITFTQQEVSYNYATGYSGSAEDASLKSVTFSLFADRDPSMGNETSDLQPQGRVYAKDRTLYTEGISGEVSVFTAVGTLVYQGKDTRIPVHQAGTYIVRHGEQVWKILVM